MSKSILHFGKLLSVDLLCNPTESERRGVGGSACRRPQAKRPALPPKNRAARLAQILRDNFREIFAG